MNINENIYEINTVYWFIASTANFCNAAYYTYDSRISEVTTVCFSNIIDTNVWSMLIKMNKFV